MSSDSSSSGPGSSPAGESPLADQPLPAGAGRAPSGLRSGPAAGLCDSCAFQRTVPNTRGSVFSLCNRSREDPSYPRYPRLPVRDCGGYEPRGGERS